MNVYLNKDKNELSFVHVKNENVCVGETDKGLESFLEFMREDWANRGLNLNRLPTIKEGEVKYE